ncbi:uncharacterized protein [Eurosta solidaginis]|uniref:uncharacterized protein isoform X2 n=1 Tax=Eurosta solidaginis TaxID=178769 RepID=UPI0035309D5C
MAPSGSVFTGSSLSLVDVTNAIGKIETLIVAKKLKKKLFYDMLLGFRVLEEGLQQRQLEAYGLVIKWFSLFLKIQSCISIQNETVRGHFEKVLPASVTYIIGCLQYQPKGIISYHFQILEMMHELLSNVRPEVLEKLASFETGIIACVWLPIDFVGDFNTQMMALRLLVMLLKCVDATRLENELDNIRCGNRSVLKEKLTAAITVANFHAAKFENTARDLLNTYNMHLARNLLVYSFRCKTFKFGDSIEFYKPMNADSFWIDFNCSPRSLSFNGRCLAYNQAIYTNCSVSLRIEKLTLNQVNLSVKFQAPAKLVKDTNDFPDISSIETAEIILPKDEAKRLIANKFVLKYYNKNHDSVESSLNTSVVQLHGTSLINNPENIEDNGVITMTSNTKAIASSRPSKCNTSRNIIKNVENKEIVPPNKKDNRGATQKYNIEQPSSSKQFQRSYDILIDDSKESHPQVIQVTNIHKNVGNNKSINVEKEIFNYKLPHLPNLYEQLTSNKLITPQRQSRTKIVNYSTSTSQSDPALETSKVASSSVINLRKRFFKTRNSTSDGEYNTTNRKKQAPRKRSTRNNKPKASNKALKKPRKINEVKPMVLSNKDVDTSGRISSNKQPLRDITANVQNTQNMITIDITESGNSNLVADIYDNRIVSDAEPGQSYRNYKTRRISIEQQDNAPEVKRSRKSLPRAVKKDMPNKGRLESSTLESRVMKSGTKRASPELMDQFDEVRGNPILRSKMRKIEATPSNDRSLTYSLPPMKVQRNATQDNIETSIAKANTSNTPTNVSNIKNNATNRIINKFQNSNKPTKNLSRPHKNNINIQKTTVNKIHTTPPISTASPNENKTQLDDIEECRRDVGQSEMSIGNNSDEFSDFPSFPNIMNISDMASSSECESTQSRINQAPTVNPTNKDFNSSTKTIPNSYSSAKNLTTNLSEPHKNLIYYSRSESDSDNEESINLHNTLEQPTAKSAEHVFVTPKMPLERFRKTTTASLTKCHVTTTETSIITQEDRFVHHRQFLVNHAAVSNTPLNLSKSCTRATTTTTTKTFVQENNELNLNSFMRRSANIRTPTPKALQQVLLLQNLQI